MAVKITPGNADDRKPIKAMTAGLKGKLYADKGYISKSLFADLWQDGLQLITGIRKNMRNYLMPLFDKLMAHAHVSFSRLSSTFSSKFKVWNTRGIDHPSMPSSTSSPASSPTASSPSNQG